MADRARFRPIAAALAVLPAETAWMDGEVVVLRPDGVTGFTVRGQLIEANGSVG